MSKDEHSVHERWARLRFAVVGPLLAAPPEPGELQAALKASAARTWRHLSLPKIRAAHRYRFTSRSPMFDRSKDVPLYGNSAE